MKAQKQMTMIPRITMSLEIKSVLKGNGIFVKERLALKSMEDLKKAQEQHVFANVYYSFVAFA